MRCGYCSQVTTKSGYILYYCTTKSEGFSTAFATASSSGSRNFPDYDVIAPVERNSDFSRCLVDGLKLWPHTVFVLSFSDGLKQLTAENG